MPQIDYILSNCLDHPRRPIDARQVCYAIGEWLAVDDRASLSRVYDRLRELGGRDMGPFVETGAALRGARLLLDGYFATRESIERVERLVREIAATAEWKTMLRCVASPVDSTWSTEIANRFSPKPEWDELTQRELIALVPMAEGYGYSITPLGRRVLEAVMRADQATAAMVETYKAGCAEEATRRRSGGDCLYRPEDIIAAGLAAVLRGRS